MPKRKQIGAIDAMAEAIAARAKSAPAPSADAEEYRGSAVNLRMSDWKFLRRVAEARADVKRGRPSVSKVIESLIDENRKKLQKELE